MLKDFYTSNEYLSYLRQQQQTDFAFGLSFGLLVGSYSIAAQLVW